MFCTPDTRVEFGNSGGSNGRASKRSGRRSDNRSIRNKYSSSSNNRNMIRVVNEWMLDPL